MNVDVKSISFCFRSIVLLGTRTPCSIARFYRLEPIDNLVIWGISYANFGVLAVNSSVDLNNCCLLIKGDEAYFSSRQDVCVIGKDGIEY